MSKWHPRISIIAGSARIAILFGGLCFKVPIVTKGLLAFYRGIYSNYYEGTWYKWSKVQTAFIPRLYNRGLFGFLLIEERCVMKVHTPVGQFDHTINSWGYSEHKKKEVLIEFYDRDNTPGSSLI